MSIFKSRKKKLENISKNKYNYINILSSIKETLINSGYNEHANIIMELQDSINNNKFECFMKQINSVKIWGGAGAVWEVHIFDEQKQKKFWSEMIELILLMKNNGISNLRANSNLKFFNKMMNN